MNEREKSRVMEHSKYAHYSDGVMQKTTQYCGEIFRRHTVQGSLLELGPAEGVMTDVLAPYFDDYTVVDGADFFVDSIQERHPNINGVVSLFEEFAPNRQYDNIVLGHVLEHVESPTGILKQCAGWLAWGGKILAAVPNAKSIHRRAGVIMGMLESEYQLNDTDRKNGHRRVYDMEMLVSDFTEAGLSVVQNGGYWLKPMSNAQINEQWTEEMVNAFLRMGEEFADIAGEIYVVAEKV